MLPVASVVGLLQPLPQQALDIELETVYIVTAVTLLTGERRERGTITLPIRTYIDAHAITRKSWELIPAPVTQEFRTPNQMQ